ncbi:Hypothetical predicted protein [Paramuricea clavata]|uniref:SCAN domain-containing protein n=1 Tax=Paramuricea clavata TaxID=317549 RepID=A0A7D9J6S9_PARCT|nr:Hypothetical predicted protein [Paramuricea clavata]
MSDSQDDVFDNIVEEEAYAHDDRCRVCGGEVGDAHQCRICKQNVHLICGVPDKDSEEGYGQKLTCSCCLNSKGITLIQSFRNEVKDKTVLIF